MGRTYRLQLLLTLASAVILRSESRGTHDHILLSQIWDYPNLEGQDPLFISHRNNVGWLYPQALVSLFVASYDSQDCGGGIRPRLYTLIRSRHGSHRKHRFYCYSPTIPQPLHRNGCLFIRPLRSNGCFLPSHCLATGLYAGSVETEWKGAVIVMLLHLASQRSFCQKEVQFHHSKNKVLQCYINHFRESSETKRTLAIPRSRWDNNVKWIIDR
jgi:hypothetical protein